MALRIVILFAFALTLIACGDDVEQRPAVADDTLDDAPELIAPAPFPGYPLIDDARLRRAPDLLDHVVPRLTLPIETQFQNLVYEATNLDLRGARNETYADAGLYEDTGEEIAARWRDAAAGSRRTLVVRDALFSQQDHPIDHSPVSVMMPPSWISVAVDAVREGSELVPVVAPAIDDDQAWVALETPRALFGSFPPSERLHEEATKPRTVLAPQRLTVTNARRTVHMLARQVRAMIDAAASGPEAVARAGADAISESDRRYFGDRLRRENIVLVLVDNPTVHERVDEGKGFRPPRGGPSEEALESARLALMRRRLRDGDIGIERVDLGRMSERRAAVDLMERLIPRSHDAEVHGPEPIESGDGRVWLYVHDGSQSAIEGALAHIYGFRMQLEGANVDMSRLVLMCRPAVPIGGGDLARKLWLASRRFRNHDLPMSLNIGTGLVGRLFDELRPTLERAAETD